MKHAEGIVEGIISIVSAKFENAKRDYINKNEAKKKGDAKSVEDSVISEVKGQADAYADVLVILQLLIEEAEKAAEKEEKANDPEPEPELETETEPESTEEEEQEPEKEKIITGIVKRPNQKPEIANIENELKVYQRLVEGYIQIIGFPNDNGIDIICNEDGKLKGLEPNIFIPEYRDVLMGTIVFAGNDGFGELCSLTESQIKKVLDYLK